MRGDWVISTILTPHLLIVQMHVSITCSLNFGIGSIDNTQIFSLVIYFQPIHLLAGNTSLSQSPMNIINWNVRGVGSTDFHIIFKDLVTSHNPDAMNIIETFLSGDKVVIGTLGFERYIKVGYG